MNNTFNFTLERKKKENTTSIHKKIRKHNSPLPGNLCQSHLDQLQHEKMKPQMATWLAPKTSQYSLIPILTCTEK